MSKIFYKNKRVYFDCNATTPVLKEALDAAIYTMKNSFGNPSSIHIDGIEAKLIIEKSREKFSLFINSSNSEIYFTSGATEGIQISVISVLRQYISLKRQNKNIINKKILISATEHKAVFHAVDYWIEVLELDLEIIIIGVDKFGHLNIHEIEEHAGEAFFLCTMAVNNETGLITNLKQIEKIIRSQKNYVYWLVDYVQALGKLNVNVKNPLIDYACFSGHKIHAPKGVGVLYVKNDAPLSPFILGGGQERGIRAGTENLPGIAAIGTVVNLLNQKKNGIFCETINSKSELNEFRNILIEAIHKSFSMVIINTDLNASVATTLNFSVFGITSSEMMSIMDAAGISVSGGSACNSSSKKFSHVLSAMKLPEWQKANAIRLSFSFTTTKDEILTGAKKIIKIGSVLKKTNLISTKNIYNYLIQNFFKRDKLFEIINFKYENSYTWLLTDNFSNSCIIINPISELAQKILNYFHCQNINIIDILNVNSKLESELAKEYFLKSIKISNKNDDNNGLDHKSIFNFSGWKIEQIKKKNQDFEEYCYIIYDNNLKNYPIIALVDSLCSGDYFNKFEPNFLKYNDKKLPRKINLFDNKTIICYFKDFNESMITTWGAEEKSDSFVKNDKYLISYEDLKNDNYLIFDVRDSYEAMLSKYFNCLCFENNYSNIPLSYFVNLVFDLIYNGKIISTKKIVFLCSTGKRSLVAAKILRKIGFKNVWSVAGGLALLKLNNNKFKFID